MTVADAIACIKSTTAPDPVLVKSIAVARRNAREQLTKELLMSVCENKEVQPLHRRRCLLQLIKLHARDGMPLREFAELIGRGSCLGAFSIEELGFGGLREYDWDWQDDSVVFIRAGLPENDETRIFLRIEGRKYRIDEITAGLLQGNPVVGDVRIKQIILKPSDVVDELLLDF